MQNFQIYDFQRKKRQPNVIFLFFFIWIFTPAHLKGVIDLNSFEQNFILEQKKIEIPQYPDAFNPSIIRWQEKLLLSFRIRDPHTKSTDAIGFIWLDDHFEPLEEPLRLQIVNQKPRNSSWPQDPRLILIKGNPYIVYSDLKKGGKERERRVYIAKLRYDDHSFSIHAPVEMSHFVGEGACLQEKNWVPFDNNGSLLLAYSLHPHRIFKPILDTGRCEIHSESASKIKWDWGTLRGGTPALKDGDEYVAIFHSSKHLTTVQSKGDKMQHYFMGGYRFLSHPPFSITKMSPHPIVGSKFYDGPSYQTWQPLRVVYPGGILIDPDYLWIVYGKQDHEIWMAKLDKKAFYDSLVPVEPLQAQFSKPHLNLK